MRFLDSLRHSHHRRNAGQPEFRSRGQKKASAFAKWQPYKVKKDMEQLEKIIEWLDQWKDRRYQTSESSIIEQSPNVTMYSQARIWLQLGLFWTATS